MNLQNASGRLSGIDLKFELDSLKIQVLWFRVMTAGTDWMIKRHKHSSFEFHFVGSGACRVKLDDGEFIAKSGEFYLTAPYVYHEQTQSEGENYTEYCINLDISPAEADDGEGAAILETLRDSPCHAVEDVYHGADFFKAALAEANDQKFGCYGNIASYARLVLVSAARALAGPGVKWYSVPSKKARNDSVFLQIQKFVKDNADTCLRAEDLSRYLYLSGKQVCRVVRQHTGRSTKSYMNYVKLQKAKSLLRETDLSLFEISEKLGFSSEYYFSQFFKREEGYPPREFRANVNNP